ncbi:MAG TPA: tetratricopeptide repeat protein [Bacillota bacterium]
MDRCNYFEILGINPEATEAEIERAFRDQIKAHPPRKDPQGFRMISEAGRLRDPEFRRDYLASLKEESIREYLEQYQMHMANREYDLALESMKAALEKQPNLPMLYNLTGHCQVAIGDYREAIIAYQKAYNLHHAAVYLYNIASTHFKDGNYEKAERFIERCLQLEPGNKKGVIMYSRILNGLGKQQQAAAVLKRAIKASVPVSSENLDLLLQLLLTYLDADQKTQVKTVLKQIKAIRWEDPTERNYAAERVWELCRILAEREYFEATYQLLLFCRESIEEPQLEEMINFYALARFLEELIDDPAVIEPLKQLFIVIFCRMDKAKKHQLNSQTRRELDLYILNQPQLLQKSLEHLQTAYPELYQLQQEYFQQLLTNLKRNQSLIQKILRGWF